MDLSLKMSLNLLIFGVLKNFFVELEACCKAAVFCSMREAQKEFLRVPFQAREVVLDGIQPQSLKSDLELTTMSYQSVF